MAHNYRVNDKSVFDIEKKIVFNVPTRNEEHILLTDLIFLIAENFKVIFPEIMKSFDSKESLLDHIEFQSIKTNALMELKIIEREIEINKNYL